LLHDHPAERARVTADPSLWSNVVEEVLRLDPPVLLTARMSVRDTELGGHPVRAGSMVTAVLGGANRDPEVFPDPLRFDVARPNARDHISFSAGRHHCLGAQLARMEGEVGLRAIWERFPDLRLEPGARRRQTRILRGFETLPATLRP
jgi:cytochrome P450